MNSAMPIENDNATLTVIVSGLPRSGTSLMMQMLAAGGVPPMQDDHRPADPDNPRGYFELEAVKGLAQSDSNTTAELMNQARGHVVKIIHRFLPLLPPATEGRAIVVMRRDLNEILASQQAMLDRLGRGGAKLDPARLGAVLEKQLEDAIEHARSIPNTRVLEVAHASTLRDPLMTAQTVATFLQDHTPAWPNSLSAKAMAATVDPTLHRQRQRPGKG